MNSRQIAKIVRKLARMASDEKMTKYEGRICLQASGLLTEYNETVKAREAREAVPNRNRRWTAEEEETLRAEYLSGKKVEELAELHGRSAGGVVTKLVQSGLMKDDGENGGKRWTKEEDAALGEEYDDGLPLEEIAAKHKRSVGGVISRLSALELLDE